MRIGKSYCGSYSPKQRYGSRRRMSAPSRANQLDFLPMIMRAPRAGFGQRRMNLPPWQTPRG